MHYSFHRRSMLALAALPLASAAAHATAIEGSAPGYNPDEATAPVPVAADQLLTEHNMRGKVLRVIEPGMAVTMDYSEDRINIEIDENRKIVRFFKG